MVRVVCLVLFFFFGFRGDLCRVLTTLTSNSARALVLDSLVSCSLVICNTHHLVQSMREFGVRCPKPHVLNVALEMPLSSLLRNACVVVVMCCALCVCRRLCRGNDGNTKQWEDHEKWCRRFTQTKDEHRWKIDIVKHADWINCGCCFFFVWRHWMQLCICGLSRLSCKCAAAAFQPLSSRGYSAAIATAEHRNHTKWETHACDNSTGRWWCAQANNPTPPHRLPIPRFPVFIAPILPDSKLETDAYHPHPNPPPPRSNVTEIHITKKKP